MRIWMRGQQPHPRADAHVAARHRLDMLRQREGLPLDEVEALALEAPMLPRMKGDDGAQVVHGSIRLVLQVCEPWCMSTSCPTPGHGSTAYGESSTGSSSSLPSSNIWWWCRGSVIATRPEASSSRLVTRRAVSWKHSWARSSTVPHCPASAPSHTRTRWGSKRKRLPSSRCSSRWRIEAKLSPSRGRAFSRTALRCWLTTWRRRLASAFLASA
mmetsp:Transcript_1931/g.5668  ORF Transcript_1931/g.5668 Transcript_1931/m.5668 type:complete len:214 (-) Transcript_1931:269-910(-)